MTVRCIDGGGVSMSRRRRRLMCRPKSSAAIAAGESLRAGLRLGGRLGGSHNSIVDRRARPA
jgi:hypothetical protein